MLTEDIDVLEELSQIGLVNYVLGNYLVMAESDRNGTWTIINWKDKLIAIAMTGVGVIIGILMLVICVKTKLIQTVWRCVRRRKKNSSRTAKEQTDYKDQVKYDRAQESVQINEIVEALRANQQISSAPPMYNLPIIDGTTPLQRLLNFSSRR